MRQVARRIRGFFDALRPSAQDQAGQSMVIIAFAMVGLLAMVGLAIDLGLVYIQRTRIKRAVDAASLAGVVELPFEQESFERSIEYLDLNDYPAEETSFYVLGCIRDMQDVDGDGNDQELLNAKTPYPYRVVDEPRNVFTLNTLAFQTGDGDSENCDRSSKTFGTSNKLLITGTTYVNMNFIQLVGPALMPVTDVAVAQNVNSLDVVVVMDRSLSMEFDTVCFNCFEVTEDSDISNQYYVQYPQNGVRHTVISSTVSSNLCGDAVTPIEYPVGTNNHYQILEGELYSLNSSSWERRSAGSGYWAIDRDRTDTWKVPRPIDPTPSDEGQTAPGTVSHHPYATFTGNTTTSPLLGRFYTLSDAQSGLAPRLEYDFALPGEWDGGSVYIWLRGKQGRLPGWSKDLDGNVNPDVIYWAVNGGAVSMADDTQGNGVGTDWTWVKLGSVSGLGTGDAPYTWHTLKIWAGSPGYTIDRIIITDNNVASLDEHITGGPASDQFSPGSSLRYNWTTPGSARRQACDPCNPIFGLNITDPRTQAEGGQCLGWYGLPRPTDNLTNDLFSDKQPMRSSKEAIKGLIGRLDARFDQVGLVYYDSTETKGSELMCVERYGQDCYEGLAGWGWPPGTSVKPARTPYSYTLVLNTLEKQEAQAASRSCIACGLRAGLEMLGINVDSRAGVDNDCDGSSDSACGRGAAVSRVMILLTDGVPDEKPADPTPCDNDPNLWANGGAPYDCGIYYAKQANEEGVVVYTIGLGSGADVEWLRAVAEEARGQFYFAPSPNELSLIFDEVLSNIYVRLIR